MADDPPPKPPKLCPVCGRAPDARFRPFCSARCRQVDLGRWLTESYTIPGRPPGEEQDE